MRAVERTGVVDEQGNLSLDEPIPAIAPANVRVIILYSDQADEDTPVEEIKVGLRRSLEEAKAGKRIPLSQMWEEMEPE